MTAHVAVKESDRTDFVNFKPADRVRAWKQCVVDCERLADDFREVLEKDQLAARLEPLW